MASAWQLYTLPVGCWVRCVAGQDAPPNAVGISPYGNQLNLDGFRGDGSYIIIHSEGYFGRYAKDRKAVVITTNNHESMNLSNKNPNEFDVLVLPSGTDFSSRDACLRTAGFWLKLVSLNEVWEQPQKYKLLSFGEAATNTRCLASVRCRETPVFSPSSVILSGSRSPASFSCWDEGHLLERVHFNAYPGRKSTDVFPVVVETVHRIRILIESLDEIAPANFTRTVAELNCAATGFANSNNSEERIALTGREVVNRTSLPMNCSITAVSTGTVGRKVTRRATTTSATSFTSSLSVRADYTASVGLFSSSISTMFTAQFGRSFSEVTGNESEISDQRSTSITSTQTFILPPRQVARVQLLQRCDRVRIAWRGQRILLDNDGNELTRSPVGGVYEDVYLDEARADISTRDLDPSIDGTTPL